MSTEKDQVRYCAHCGNKSPHKVIYSVRATSGVLEPGTRNEFDYAEYYFLAKCGSCEDVSLFSDWDLSDNFGDLDYAVLEYPYVKKFDRVVPETIRVEYEEAKKVLKISPIAFAILARRATEMICSDQKAKGTNLKEKIEDLAKRDVIPKSLARMAGAIRYLGNIGAHSDAKIISGEEAQILNDFVITIIEYVYIAPAKLEELAEKIKIKQKKD